MYCLCLLSVVVWKIRLNKGILIMDKQRRMKHMVREQNINKTLFIAP